MDRLIRLNEGFTLLELLVSLALGAVILLTSSNFMINYAKYSSNFIKSEGNLTMMAIGTFEDIVYRINQANKTAIVGLDSAITTPNCPFPTNPTNCTGSGTCIQIRCDRVEPTTPTDYSDDTVYNYWKSGTNIYQSTCTSGGTAAGTVAAPGINVLSFARVDKDNNVVNNTNFNTIRVIVEAEATSGVTGGVRREYLDTTAVARQRSST